METGTKKHIREEVLIAREAMTTDEWRRKSRQIRENLMNLPAFTHAAHILCYVNYKNEAETISLISQCLASGRHVYCPLVTGKDMDFYEIFSVGELQEGFHGILEPPFREKYLFIPHGKQSDTLMIMPGAVFDRAHHRIGYGGGYYDKYLQRFMGIVTAALAFSFQIRDEIPYEPHDICPQIIVTENGEI